MDPAERQHAAQAPDPSAAQANGTAGAPGAADEPLLAPPASGPPRTESPEDAAARMAAEASRNVGGLIARVDQLETKIARVDRQTLMLIGMVAVLAWSVKSLAGKVGVDAPAAAPAS